MVTKNQLNKYFKYASCDQSKVDELLEKIAASSDYEVLFREDTLYDESKSVAYCYKKYNNYFVHNTAFMDESTINYARMHELSHIYLGHLDINKETIHKTFENTVLPHLPNIRKRFEADITNDKIIDYLYIQMSNIAQDMEINSTVYGSTAGWKNAEAALQKAFIEGCLLNGKDNLAEQYFNSVKAHDGKFELCHPSNKNWPIGLSWINYIILLAKDEDAMNKALDDAQDKMENSGDEEEQNEQNQKNGSDSSKDENNNESGEGSDAGDDEGEGSEGESNGEGSEGEGNSSSEGSEGNGKPSKQKPSKCGKGRPQISFEQVKEAIDAEISKTGDKSLSSENRGKDAMMEMLGVSKTGGTNGSITICKDSDKDLEAFLKKTFNLKKVSVRSDQMYYTNRNRFGSGAPVIPRRYADERYVPTTCHFLVDISGSMDSNRILKNISTIKEMFSKGLDAKNSHIILCNSTVQADFTLDKIPESIDIGGGTNLINGLAYISQKKYMDKRNSTLFIMSDFEDYTISGWSDIAVNFKGDVCGIFQEGRENKKLIKFNKKDIAKDVRDVVNL